MRYFYLLILSLCTLQNLHAYLYQAIVMHRWNDLYKRYHYFIGLGDFHNKQHYANQKQQDQFLALAADCKGLKLLTEDLSVSNSDGRGRGGKFYVNSRGGFLGGITDTCLNVGIDVDNLEYRYARVCSLAPVLNNRDKSPCALAPVVATSVGDVVSEISHESDRIVKFDDGPVLNEWYKSCVAGIDKKITTYGLTDNAMSMADYLMRKKNSLPLIKKLLTFDCVLLDAKIVHEVINNQDKERVCAIAGGSHIERVGEILKKVGYQPILFINQASSYDGIESCVQSSKESDHMSNKRPQPIDLDRLKRFF